MSVTGLNDQGLNRNFGFGTFGIYPFRSSTEGKVTSYQFWQSNLYLKSFTISKLHEIYIVASQKFEEFGNECPHYTPSKAQWIIDIS